MIAFTRDIYIFEVTFINYEPAEEVVDTYINIKLDGIEIYNLAMDINKLLLDDKYSMDLEQLIVSETVSSYIDHCDRIRRLKINEGFLEYSKTKNNL